MITIDLHALVMAVVYTIPVGLVLWFAFSGPSIEGEE